MPSSAPEATETFPSLDDRTAMLITHDVCALASNSTPEPARTRAQVSADLDVQHGIAVPLLTERHGVQSNDLSLDRAGEKVRAPEAED